jgi:hypothetical protein
MMQCGYTTIIVHITSSQCNALTPVPWGEAKWIQIVKEPYMAGKSLAMCCKLHQTKIRKCLIHLLNLAFRLFKSIPT